MEDQDEPLTNAPAGLALLLALVSVGINAHPYWGVLALPIAILALAFGLAGRKRSKTPHRPGRAMSIWALSLASVGALLGTLQIVPGWQAGYYVDDEPDLKDLNPMTCAEFQLPDDWAIAYEAIGRPIWVIDFQGSDGQRQYVALRYRSPSCRAHPDIAPLLDN